MEARTSGKHGFGFPKIFIVSSLESGISGTFTISYRDTAVTFVSKNTTRRNYQLLISAINQFCETNADLSKNLTVELTLPLKQFAGVITNRKGRIMSSTSFLPVDSGQRRSGESEHHK